MVRNEMQSSFGDDYMSFLKSSAIRLTIRPDCEEDFERIAELVQRTNQLNFSGHKYTRDELLKLFQDPLLERYVLVCEDKFGQYGTIGFCMARNDGATVHIEDLMLSCRVQGKLIESALFAHLCFGTHKAIETIKINFKKTDRNMPAQHVLTKLGFDISQASPIFRTVEADTFKVDFIQVQS
jgi:FkbH-like protein